MQYFDGHRDFVLGMLLCVLGNSMVGVEKYLFPTLVDQYQRMMENAGMGTSALTVFASVAVAPIGEELLCRGVTLHYTKKLRRPSTLPIFTGTDIRTGSF